MREIIKCKDLVKPFCATVLPSPKVNDSNNPYDQVSNITNKLQKVNSISTKSLSQQIKARSTGLNSDLSDITSNPPDIIESMASI